MNLTLRSTLDTLLARSPVQRLFSRRSKRRLTVLAYHGVDDPVAFTHHLDWLQDNTQVIGEQGFIDALTGHERLPSRAVLITFDDGHRSVLEHGLPLLRARGLPAIAFVVTGLVDSARPFWWSEVEDLVSAGGTVPSLPNGLGPRGVVNRLKAVPNDHRLSAIEQLRSSAGTSATMMPQLTAEDLRELEAGGVMIGNHTRTHPILPRCTDEEIQHEIRAAHEQLRGLLGRSPRLFAYPNGDCDDRSVAAVVDCGYEAAFLFDHRQATFPPVDRFRISRVRVNSYTPMNRFRTIVSGMHPAIHHLWGRP